MAQSDFGFSLSENSVNEINSLIEQYSQEIIAIMNGFQDDLIEHISIANYDKLLKAVDGIIELYNNFKVEEPIIIDYEENRRYKFIIDVDKRILQFNNLKYLYDIDLEKYY